MVTGYLFCRSVRGMLVAVLYRGNPAAHLRDVALQRLHGLVFPLAGVFQLHLKSYYLHCVLSRVSPRVQQAPLRAEKALG